MLKEQLQLLDTIDFIIILLIIMINFYYREKEINFWLTLIIAGISIGLILPSWSVAREIDRVTNEIDDVDNYELFYTYFNFLNYWVILFVQLIVIGLKTEPEINKEEI